jgi:hypothetical protein
LCLEDLDDNLQRLVTEPGTHHVQLGEKPLLMRHVAGFELKNEQVHKDVSQQKVIAQSAGGFEALLEEWPRRLGVTHIQVCEGQRLLSGRYQRWVLAPPSKLECRLALLEGAVELASYPDDPGQPLVEAGTPVRPGKKLRRCTRAHALEAGPLRRRNRVRPRSSRRCGSGGLR